MTSPYPPPSNQPGGDGWGGDLNSPFGPSASGDQASPYGPPPPGQQNESQEPSPYEGVQYELEAQTPPPPSYPPMSGPPMSGPPGYGPPPPPPGYGPPPPGYPQLPPQKSGSNTGLIVGGVIGGVVILVALAVFAVFIIVDDSGSDDRTGGESGGGEAQASEEEEAPTGYQMISDPCGGIKSDVEAIGQIDGNFDSSGSSTGETGYGSCYTIVEKEEGDYENYGYFSAHINVYDSPESAQSGYEDSVDYSLSACQESDLSSGWEQGTIGDCSTGSSEKTVIVVQDANIDIAISLEITGDLGVDDQESTLTSMIEKIFEDLKA